MTDSNGDSRFVTVNIIDAVRHHFAFFLVGEIVSIDLARLPFWFVGSAHSLLISKDFLLLRIDRDGWFTTTLLDS